MNITNILKTGVLAVFALAAINSSAANIDVNTARATAGKFINKNKNLTMKAGSTNAIKLAHAEASNVSGNAYYVFNIDGGGWVIVAGDDRAKQVLAYGDKGSIDMKELPGNMKDYLDLYKNQIEEMQSYKGEVVPAKAPRRSVVVEPLTKSTWGQAEPMDRQTPMISSTEHGAVGCGPLALAQIMYYWKYPSGSPAIDQYYIYMFGTVPALPETTFDYNLMLDKYTVYNPTTGGVSLGTYTNEQAEEVAKLCRYCGQACKVRYGGNNGSGSYTYDQRDAFLFMGFNEGLKLVGIDPASYCDNYRQGKYKTEEWIELICTELEAGRPIAYHNVDFIDGHAWVLDGVDADGKFHMNWGFYERFDGWFEFNAFTIYPNGETWNFNGSGNEMVINIYPYDGYVIPGDDEVLYGDVNGDGVVNPTDATALINALLNEDLSTINEANADMDGNQTVNVTDAIQLINYLLSL